MKIKIGVSNRHVHLNENDFKKIFNDDVEMKKLRNLTQLDDYASNLTVTLKTTKSTMEVT